MLTLGIGGAAIAQTSPVPDTNTNVSTVPEPTPSATTPPAAESGTPAGFGHDFGQYFTSPLHWNGSDWAWFGGALVAIGASHHYDSQVYTHFTKGLTPAQIANINSNDLQDAIPAAIVFVATWGYAAWVGDSSGHR